MQIVDEDRFRSEYLLPTSAQALDMLAAKKDQERLAVCGGTMKILAIVPAFDAEEA